MGGPGERSGSPRLIGSRLQSKTMFQKIVNEKFLGDLARTLKTKLDVKQKIAVFLLAKEADENGVVDRNQFAYILGTCWHECRFRSIPEIRAKPGTQVWRWQNAYWPSGYYGRGFSQLTWKGNYRKFSKIVGVDLVNFPDKVLEPEIGAKILVVGMVRGLFSGVGLSRYFPEGKTPDWTNARRIVNGTFQADKVAAGAVKILSVIVANEVPTV